MGKPYSVDLRTRVVGAVDEGDSVDEVAERYKVSGRAIWSWLALRAETGRLAPPKGAVGPQPKLDEHRETIIAAIQAAPSLTVDELRAKLELPGCRTTLWKTLERWGQSLKTQ